jgi:uncharacterized membrane protein YsdA (DUF1294 family)
MTYTESLYVFTAYVVALSAAGFMAAFWDREAARKNTRRIPERILLALALLGGSIGVIAGLRLARHKAGRSLFRTYLRMIVIIQFTVLMSLSFPATRDSLMEILP